jgi:CBS domain containing-hemolysin-like protein
LKAAALGGDLQRTLDAFRRPIPVLHDTEPVVRAFERVLVQHESIALVADRNGRTVGLVTIEDMLEAILGLEITDEAETVAALRPAVAKSRRQRAEELRRRREQVVPAQGESEASGQGRRGDAPPD